MPVTARCVGPLLWVLAASPVEPPAAPLSLIQMASEADLVVVATVRDVGGSEVGLRVERAVRGTAPGRRIRVRKLDRRTRWAPYAVGQQVLLFLHRGRARWSVMSAGGEGEMPLVDDKVYYRPSSRSRAGTRYRVHGHELWAVTLQLEDVVAAVRQYPSLCRMGGGRRGGPAVTVLVSEGELQAFGARSAAHALLVEQTRRAAGSRR
jgi:hypothetical protein